ncbi:MAG: inverse autotransporter beta domain-containing protein [Planctomycetota bacterium]|nr:inverse autotransporter beta domain-containing protein [Planctomycetota bacterium]
MSLCVLGLRGAHVSAQDELLVDHVFQPSQRDFVTSTERTDDLVVPTAFEEQGNSDHASLSCPQVCRSYRSLSLFGEGCGDRLYTSFTAWEFKPGNERVLGSGQVVVPLWQDAKTLLFADVRGQVDDQESSEGNWGLGLRTMIDDSWIAGAYGFYDLRRSEFNNNFNQATFGLEALSVDWEARINGYIPESGAATVAALNAAQVSNGTIVVRGGEERAYYGVDAEVGALLADSECGDLEVRGFLGGFHFDNDAENFENISGVRARLELRAYDLSWLGEGSRLTLGSEYQWDDVRDGQVFAMARIRVPLGPARARTLTRLERRMMDRIVRDVDVVAQANPGASEAAINPLTGMAFGPVQMVDASGDLQAALDSAGEDSTVIVSGTAGEFTPMSTINLLPGQTLLGGGSSMTVTGMNTGTVATFNSPGTRPTINQTDSDTDVIALADNTAVFGNTILGGRDGISAEGVEGSIVIQNNTIQDSNGDGIDIDLSDGEMLTAHIENNMFQDITGNGVFLDVDDDGVLTTTITNNQFLTIDAVASAGDNIFIDVSDEASVLGVITGNTATGGVDGLDIRSLGDGPNVFTIGGNSFLSQTDTGIRIFANDTFFMDGGNNNTVSDAGVDAFTFATDTGFDGSILINGSPEN